MELYKIGEILSLFPPTIIMPLFYKDDIVELIEGGFVKIIEVGWKNGGYIYYFNDDENELVFTYEDDFIF